MKGSDYGAIIVIGCMIGGATWTLIELLDERFGSLASLLFVCVVVVGLLAFAANNSKKE